MAVLIDYYKIWTLHIIGTTQKTGRALHAPSQCKKLQGHNKMSRKGK